MIEPNSIADKNKITVEDEITLINGEKITKSLKDYLNACQKEMIFTIKKKFSEKEITLAVGNYYKLLELRKNKSATKQQLTLRKIWSI